MVMISVRPVWRALVWSWRRRRPRRRAASPAAVAVVVAFVVAFVVVFVAVVPCPSVPISVSVSLHARPEHDGYLQAMSGPVRISIRGGCFVLVIYDFVARHLRYGTQWVPSRLGGPA